MKCNSEFCLFAPSSKTNTVTHFLTCSLCSNACPNFPSKSCSSVIMLLNFKTIWAGTVCSAIRVPRRKWHKNLQIIWKHSTGQSPETNAIMSPIYLWIIYKNVKLHLLTATAYRVQGLSWNQVDKNFPASMKTECSSLQSSSSKPGLYKFQVLGHLGD